MKKTAIIARQAQAIEQAGLGFWLDGQLQPAELRFLFHQSQELLPAEMLFCQPALSQVVSLPVKSPLAGNSLIMINGFEE